MQQVPLAEARAPTLVTARTRLRGYGRATKRFITHKPLGFAGLFVMLVVVLAAVFANVVDIHDPLAQDYLDRLMGPGLAHWMGTDAFGRDLYSRVVHGARVSLLVSFFAISIGSTTGLVIGIASGYFAGWFDNLVQRSVEVMLAFPTIVLALALMTVLGEGLGNIIIVITIVFIPRTLRTIRGTVMSVKQNVYVDAARVIGAGHMRIMFHHILPNVMAPYLITATTLLGAAILIEATLSFLGLGVPPPYASWGRMLSGAAQKYAMSAPWMVLFPGLAITTLVMGFNLFGDALRDVSDPRLRGT